MGPTSSSEARRACGQLPHPGKNRCFLPTDSPEDPKYLNVIDATDVHALSSTALLTVNGVIELKDVHSALIRYPYDLIPPHTGSFAKRESTEYLKSLALVLRNVSLNPIDRAWAMRNRLYSLDCAQKYGVPVPSGSCILRHCAGSSLLPDGQKICKAIGNCFHSWGTDEIPAMCQELFKLAEDDGENAVIMPAQILPSSLHAAIECCASLFAQSYIHAIREHRLYIIGESIFMYAREPCCDVDKSAASYIRTDFRCPQKTVRQLKIFQSASDLMYCCYDLMEEESGDCTVIDINPFGSLPSFEEISEPTEALAELVASHACSRAGIELH